MFYSTIKQVPSKSFVGRDMEGITVKIVDEHGTVDTGIDGYNHSVSVDWQKGVAFPFVKGECVLPPVRLPNKPGWWQGRVRFSANQSLCVELKVFFSHHFSPLICSKLLVTSIRYI